MVNRADVGEDGAFAGAIGCVTVSGFPGDSQCLLESLERFRRLTARAIDLADMGQGRAFAGAIAVLRIALDDQRLPVRIEGRCQTGHATDRSRRYC